MPTAPPVIVIEFRIESAPRVLIHATTADQEQRVWDWVGAHDEYRELVARALELAEQERAA
jgi:hypothetical protein